MSFDLWLLMLRGAALAVTVAAPVGPMALLVVERTMTAGAGAGLFTGYGIATAHMLWGSAAAASVTALLDVASRWHGGLAAMQAVIASVLMVVAVRTARRPAPQLPASGATEVGRSGRFYLVGLLCTAGNPLTGLGFGLLTPGIVGETGADAFALAAVALGILAGSAAWWSTVVLLLTLARTSLGPRGLRLANVAIACLLFAAGAAMMLKAADPARTAAPVTARVHFANAAIDSPRTEAEARSCLMIGYAA